MTVRQTFRRAATSSSVRALVVTVLLASAAPLGAQAPRLSQATRAFVSVDAPVLALTHVRVVDGTGAPPAADQTVVVRDGLIAAVGPAASVQVPAGARTIDLSGKSLIPGLVMLHEHMFYPAGGPGAYNELVYSFPRLYLAGGVTTMRTGGNMSGYTDFNIRRAIDAGEVPGPHMDTTGPYLEGPGLPIPYIHALTGADDARRMVGYWADQGATSFKAYMHISRAELGAAVEEAHKRGLKVTGHLCSVTFSEAADLGIDDLEHGLVVSTDFVADKKPDECPPGDAVQTSIAALDVNGPALQALIKKLVDKHVAVTSTLTVFETFVPGRAPASNAALDAMAPEVRDAYLRRRARIAVDAKSPWATLFSKEMAFEHAFAKAGGLLVSGTDPTGYGGVVAGFSNQREIELLVEAGFTPVEAIQVATMNGATYLGRQSQIGSIAVGKAADLVVVDGDPASKIEDITKVETVFKDGIGYDSAKLVAAARGLVGLR
ncbi:MAG: amidohydrolase family protein [Betaproteobacteria bacterium]